MPVREVAASLRLTKNTPLVPPCFRYGAKDAGKQVLVGLAGKREAKP